MEWGNHLFTLAALALCVLPIIKLLSESLSGAGADSTARRDIWAKPAPAWRWYAKLAAMIALGSILMVAWLFFMIETFTPPQ
ncbi:TPA: hypothetical protein R1B06_004505 [Escherichia coli]|nr:hypothetical protein [Escherichia coli]HDC5041499.1 hypothetical protein [Escherichia coli]HEB9054782.1 hypothetical protein [Escherichia coli]